MSLDPSVGNRPDAPVWSAPWNPWKYRVVSREVAEVLRRPLEQRAAGLTSLLSRVQVFVEWLSGQRDQAVLEMRRRGASYDDLAKVLGVSKSRAQQICARLQREQGTASRAGRRAGL